MVDWEIRLFQIATTVHVMAMSTLHHLSVKITFVRRPMMLGHLGEQLALRSMIPYGMARAVQQLSPASVPSTTPPGSASSFPSPQLMILKHVFVELSQLAMKTHLLSLWNSTFANGFRVTLWEQHLADNFVYVAKYCLVRPQFSVAYTIYCSVGTYVHPDCR